MCVLGLGYVGLRLAVEFGKVYKSVGFERNENRVQQLKQGIDTTLEVDKISLGEAKKLSFTYDINEIKECDIYVVTVPTPIDKNKNPDLQPLIKASELLGKVINRQNIVIYESTVYPGVTEEICSPILSEISNLQLNEDFYLGYSPERINPGDKNHRVSDIVKITSGSTRESAQFIDQLYSSIIVAVIFKVSSIQVAEAAMVIEITLRDINTSLIN